jgi:DHA2 family multidrug resistance protein
VSRISHYLTSNGRAPPDAARAAYGYVYEHLQVQAHFLTFMDRFHVIGVFTLVAAPLVLLTKPLTTRNKNRAGH